MSREHPAERWREGVQVMLDDIARISSFIGSQSREEFIADERTVFAVCYAFVRLGEAVAHVPAEVRDPHPEIERRDIRQFRNFMIHAYLAVDPARLYDTANHDLPSLALKLRSILDALSD